MKLIYSLEDDKSISDIIYQTLTKTGYKVKCFYDAQTFLKLLMNISLIWFYLT